MKKVLVLYYSQSGQLTHIVKQLTDPLAQDSDLEVTLATLAPETPYPFPWSLAGFLNVFPESVLEIPCALQPLDNLPDQDYDLIILAFQVWYLSPSIPVSSFLQSSRAARLLRQRPVITLIGCRNMWTQAHQKALQRIRACGGQPVGNIVLEDRAPNLVGVITIVYWMLTGRKERPWGLLPLPGIAPADMAAAGRFAAPMVSALKQNCYATLADELQQLGAVTPDPACMLLEKRLHPVFRVWAAFIRRRGGPESSRRRNRLRLFAGYLISALLVLAPLVELGTRIRQSLRPNP